MPETGKKFKTKLTVTSKEVAHNGTSDSGKDWTIWEVFANDEAGQPVTEKLRSFEDLPENQLIEVHAEEYNDDRRGTTYTLSTRAPRGQKNTNSSRGQSGGLAKSVDELRARVEQLTKDLATAVVVIDQLVKHTNLELTDELPKTAPQAPPIAGL